MPAPPTIPQQSAEMLVDPYIIAGFMPEPQPLIGCFSKTDAFAGTADISDALSDALSIDLGSRCRWLADPAKLTDHGDGTWRWVPSQGSDLTSYWQFDAANVPAIDSTYDYALKDKSVISKPAAIFDGDIWAQLHGFPSNLDEFTVLLVARLRGTNGGARAGIVESLRSGADPDASSDVFLRQKGQNLKSQTVGVFVEDLIENTGRPQLVGASHAAALSRQILVDRDRTIQAFHHPNVDAYDTSFYLGRTGATYDSDETMIMDVLEILIYDSALSHDQLVHRAHQLNAIYAVHG